MDKPIRILVVDDDEMGRKTLGRLLSKSGYQVETAEDGQSALSLLSSVTFGLVITDLVMDQVSGLDVLSATKSRSPETEVMVVTGFSSIQTAIEATKKGAFHYLEKPFRADEVLHLVRQALEKWHLRQQVRSLESRVQDETHKPVLVGQSPCMVEVIKLLRQVSKADCNVLLTGESGTGKELVASLLHAQSGRAENEFLGINCGSFTEELLTNELFGHEKGSFTGATSSKPGLLESASGGTLLLDEVGDMPLSMQVKLLRAIQEQEVIRVGGNRPFRIDVRIIASTNQDLKAAVNAGLFRHDLYFRLNVVSIHIPPLKERREDIPLLAHYFLDRFAKRANCGVKGFTREAMSVLTDYGYPGNVRELENIVERAVVLAQGDLIQTADLPPDLSEIDVFSFSQTGSVIKPLREIQREYVQWVLNQVGRNKTRAAQVLGVDRTTLWRHLKDHEIVE
jgi:DNA-binding NtrC family response regulator